MSMWRFLLRYMRRYVPWAVLAAVAMLGFALATASMVTLVEPIFGEVLRLESDERPEALELVSGDPEQESDGALSRAGLKGLFDAGYEALKDAFDVDARNVYYFVPLLFVVVFAVRSFSNFVSGYSFQRIGLGVTTDIRNDLYRRILDQSSRLHAGQTAG